LDLDREMAMYACLPKTRKCLYIMHSIYMSLGLGGVCQIETDFSNKKLKKLFLKDDIIKGETIS
jgi:hypothetical protein